MQPSVPYSKVFEAINRGGFFHIQIAGSLYGVNAAITRRRCLYGLCYAFHCESSVSNDHQFENLNGFFIGHGLFAFLAVSKTEVAYSTVISPHGRAILPECSKPLIVNFC